MTQTFEQYLAQYEALIGRKLTPTEVEACRVLWQNALSSALDD